MVKETIGSAALPAPGERGNRSGRSRHGAGERGGPGLPPGGPGPRWAIPAGTGNSCSRPPPHLWFRSSGPSGGGRRGEQRGRTGTGTPQPPARGPWLSPSAGAAASPARSAKAVKISLPSLGKPQPSLSQARGTPASAGPGGRNPGFSVLAPARGQGGRDFSVCMCTLFFPSFCVCVRVYGWAQLSEKRNFRVTTKGFLVQLF